MSPMTERVLAHYHKRRAEDSQDDRRRGKTAHELVQECDATDLDAVYRNPKTVLKLL